MSRSGYSDDAENVALWRGVVQSAIRGRRGQAFLRALADAMDAMPIKRLTSHALERPDGVCAAATYQGGAEPAMTPCAMGALGQARGVDMSWFSEIDAEDDPHALAERLGADFDIAHQLAMEVQWVNDEATVGVRVPDPTSRWGYRYRDETPEERWARVRRWVEENTSGGG